MIGRLRGTVLERNPPELLVEVAGVGYELLVPLSICARLPAVGKEVMLQVHTVVRKDGLALYGFGDSRERELFRQLLKVGGVGPQIALAALSGMDADQFVHCVRSGDKASLTRLPGIGRRTAERILLELGDRLEELASGAAALDGGDVMNQVLSALQHLGYRQAEARKALEAVAEPAGLTMEELLRQALQKLVHH